MIKNLVSRLIMMWRRILSYFPTKLPVGASEFEVFANDIMELAGKYADENSMKFAIATMVLHADSKLGSISKNYFVVRLRKSAANQVASQIFQDIKEKQAAQAAQPKAAEDTPAPVVSDGKSS